MDLIHNDVMQLNGSIVWGSFILTPMANEKNSSDEQFRHYSKAMMYSGSGK